MIEKTFSPQDLEEKLYADWEKSGLFACNPKSNKPTYTIMMPPPNVTGSLHVGHALTYTLQDVLIRFKRMSGYDVLWQPGTDHAGIATQMVVERNLEKDGVSRHDLGREAFIDKIWEWKNYSGGEIVRQQRRLGISPDWSRQRFTMDEGLSAAVRKVFVQLFKDGLIYRDKRLVNWDPKFQTAVSDLEVIPQDTKGNMYHIRYPLVSDAEKFITIATTRPETMLGDTAVAVHPADERYKDLVGQTIKLPLIGREIPIVADDYCDQEKGTGAVKITPAHDFNDFELGRRHQLPLINIMDERAHLNNSVPDKYRGLSVAAARKQILADLEELGLLEKVEPIIHAVPFGERSNVEIQPMLTDQWFLDAYKLAQPALAAVRNGKTTFVPEFWNATYFDWLENIQPWCISRQIWWGHQVPAWFADDGSIFVAETEAEAQAQAQEKFGKTVTLTRDPDVLDTWFSSALWPFTTLGWPDDSLELKRYYPTDVLDTGFDIIFFWVARMMMMGLYFIGEVPFKTVYIHALVRDEKGAKMSKSKGNVMDPLVLMDKFGTDALRFTLASLAVPGRDLKLGESRVEGGRNFMTKIWNAARFMQMNECARQDNFIPPEAKLTVNRWIISEMAELATRVFKSIETYRFDDAANDLYRFLWGTFCDFYLEFLKPIFANVEDAAALAEARATASWVLAEFLRVAHPIMPFITEELWKSFGDGQMLLGHTWPSYGKAQTDTAYIDSKAQEEMQWLVNLIIEIRSRRSEFNVAPGAPTPLSFHEVTSEIEVRIRRHEVILKRLGRISDLTIQAASPNLNKGDVQFVVGETTIVLPLADSIDLEAEMARLKKEIDAQDKEITTLEARLNNADFISKAKPEIISEFKERLGAANQTKAKVQQALNRLA
ncbi:valine--tRNA ligase [Candidatus Odyssella acanthamoebae]|uniref:Valine--tRNA ligase n=1 Tax=Candidatus Odyssella acanthamoebae TaxID=91604 RepID=A0A077AWK3_9PROT|nr:valine--tRNA ligase [Candidatus Paracaedibacter acanthamoebae]AIK96836.1 valyl-tRNA synthetase [Candidatus Paracaedibacter acanthamoebae]